MHHCKFMFNFLRNCVGAMNEGSSLLIFMIILVADCLFDNGHFRTYEMVFTCCLIYISLITDDAEHNHNILVDSFSNLL